MSNKPTAPQNKSIEVSKEPHRKHLQRIAAACLYCKISAEPGIIDLILRLDKAITEKGGTFTMDDAQAVNDENIAYHSKN